MTVRFIHTADLQIGKGFGQFPSDVSATLRNQRLATLQNVAQLARDRTLDFILVAGDYFDDRRVKILERPEAHRPSVVSIAVAEVVRCDFRFMMSSPGSEQGGDG